MLLYTVILAGGGGSRLWPLSRAHSPKQFLSFDKAGTLLQKTFKRNQIIDSHKTYIIGNREHAGLVERQLDQCGVKNYVLIIEPEQKDTAPAIISAALNIYKSDPTGIMLVAPSDNEIKEEQEYKEKILVAKKLAEKGYYVAFGIVPTRPENAYGYIKQGEQIEDEAFAVERFVEKPPIHKARKYIATSQYYWNSGIFVIPVKKFLEDIKVFEPKMLSCVRLSLEGAKLQDNKIFLEQKAFSLIEAKSIDYAFMEKSNSLAFIKCNFFWSDMGTWSSIWEAQKKDCSGNALSPNVVVKDTKDSLIFSKSNKLIAAVGVENISVIDTPDALLIINTALSNNVKAFIKGLSLDEHFEAGERSPLHREWGNIEEVASGSGYAINRIFINPEQSLPWQYQKNQNKFWTILKGVAEVTINNEVKILKSNEQISIPTIARYRVCNLGKQNLEFIEILTGDYSKEGKVDASIINEEYEMAA